MLQILIGTTDMTAFLASRSLKIDMDTSHWKSCSLTLHNLKINDGVPEEGKLLTVKWLETGNPDILVFKGVINNKSIKQLSPNLDELTVSLSSNGFRNIPFRRTISEVFEIVAPAEYIAAGNIVKFLIDTYLEDEGISYFDNGIISSILEGKLYDNAIEFVCMNIGEILDQLATDSNANWYINSSNILYFVEEYYSFDGDSDYDIDTELGITADVRNLDLKTDLTNYANKVFFKGDIEDATMDNIQVFSQDADEIWHMAQLDGGSGVYGVSVSNSNITTTIEAQAYCDKELAKRKVKPKAITFDTFDWKAYQVGERHNVNIPIIGVNNEPIYGEPEAYTVTNQIVLTSHKLTNGIKIKLAAGTGTIPSGLNDNDEYYVIDSTVDSFRLSLDIGGSAVDITSTGISGWIIYRNNYVVESISLSDMGKNILSKKIEMRQLFSDVIGGGAEGVTWQKGKQGIAYFKALTDNVKKSQTDTKNMIKNHIYVENLRGGSITTQNFDGSGDYVKLERQFMTFWEDSAPDIIKMAMGFVPDKNNNKIPGIVFGAGDGYGNSRGYITKGTTGLDIFYITPTGGVARIRLGNDGKIYINETEIQAFSETSQIPSEYIEAASGWNAQLSQMKSDGSTFEGKVSQDLSTNVGNYMQIDGTYGDMTLYYNNTEYFKILNGLGQNSIFKNSGKAFLDIGVNGSYADVLVKGDWDFSTAHSVTGITAKFG
jgi:hypothetical protein